MSQGWVSIHRSILDGPLWTDERFTKGQAWLDLILNANHTDKKALIKNTMIMVKRGEQIRSKLTLSKVWGWNRKTVSSFLLLLEKEQMITQHSTQQTTHITICNYSKYQDINKTDGQQLGQQLGQQRDNNSDTNNNVNNVNKGTKDQETRGKTKKRFSPPSQTEIIEHSLLKNLNATGFFNYYESNGWMVGKNKMKDWKAALRGWDERQGGFTGNSGQSKPSQERQKFVRKPSKDFINENPAFDENVLDGEFTRMNA